MGEERGSQELLWKAVRKGNTAAVGRRRFSEGTSADREIQRTLMELLSQLDGFDPIGKV